MGRLGKQFEGILKQREDGINDNIDSIDLEIEQMELRVQKFKEGLIAKFTAMETIVSQLNSTGDFLSQVKFPGFGGGDDS